MLPLVAFSLVTMVVFVVDSAIYARTIDTWPTIALLADLRVPSLLVACGLMRAATNKSFRTPQRIAPRFWIACVAWPAGAFLLVHFTGVGRVPLPRWQDVVAFNVSGLLVEELLCRGVVLGAATKVWPGRAALVSALLFGLMHHQHHHFAFDAAAWMQVAWTLPFGFLLARLTQESRSLWPAIVVHAVNNALVQLA